MLDRVTRSAGRRRLGGGRPSPAVWDRILTRLVLPGCCEFAAKSRGFTGQRQAAQRVRPSQFGRGSLVPPTRWRYAKTSLSAFVHPVLDPAAATSRRSPKPGR